MRQPPKVFGAWEERTKLNCLALLTAISLGCLLAPARAGVTPQGDVSPSNPSTWTSSTQGYIGNTASGAIILDGGDLCSQSADIGHASAATGIVNLCGAGSLWTNGGSLYVGNSGSGTLSLSAGGKVDSGYGDIGFAPGSSGAVTIDGAGSGWTNSGATIGVYGSGSLSITGGGHASGGDQYIALDRAAKGSVLVAGAGSAWTNSGGLCIGWSGTATMAINGGGEVTAKSVSIDAVSRLDIDIGRGSVMAVGSGAGAISNSGTIRILAGAGVVADGKKHSPILAGTWSGNGACQAIGGAWDKTAHLFTASNVAAGASGSPLAIDLASVQRTLVDDDATGWQVGASFVAAAANQNVSYTATILGGTPLEKLKGLLSPRELVLSGWSLTATGYAVDAGNPLYLSLKVGLVQLLDDLNLWQYSGSNWTAFSPADLTYDRKYASFTLSASGTYAISGDLVLDGDANRDGRVDFADLGIVTGNYGLPGDWASGDFTGDGIVNFADLGMVTGNYGASLPPGTTVPEPGALVLLAVGLAALWICAHGKREKL